MIQYRSQRLRPLAPEVSHERRQTGEHSARAQVDQPNFSWNISETRAFGGRKDKIDIKATVNEALG
jgi:hypothetical protein